MERSNTHPNTDEKSCPIKAGSINWEGYILSLQQEIEFLKRKVVRLEDHIAEKEEEDDEEEDWEDITACVLTYTIKKDIISTELQMAGGGSHSWWYVLEWVNTDDDEPNVFITTLYEKKQPTNKTLILRAEGNGVEEVKLVNKGEDLPEDDDDYTYHRFQSMTSPSNTRYDDGEDDDDEEEDFNIEYDCPHCLCDRGKHDVSKNNRLIPCESDGEDDDDEEDDPQYKKPCGDCGRILCINTSIMCYSNADEGDMTLCSTCYWDNKWWADDENEDNADDWKEHICERAEHPNQEEE